MAKSSNLDRLAAAYDAAALELNIASAAASEAAQKLEETERELNLQQRILDALEGRNPRLREKLLDSVEYANANPDEYAAKIKELWKTLHGHNAKLKEVSARVQAAKIAESKAFGDLQSYRHKEAVRELLKIEIQLHRLLRQERAIRDEGCNRGGTTCGSMPVFSQPSYDPAIVWHRIRAAVECGYITADESSFKL